MVEIGIQSSSARFKIINSVPITDVGDDWRAQAEDRYRPSEQREDSAHIEDEGIEGTLDYRDVHWTDRMGQPGRQVGQSAWEVLVVLPEA